MTRRILSRSYQVYKDAGIRIDYHPQNAVAEVRGDVAWVTVTLHSVWTADTPAGQAMLGVREGYATYVESFILVKTSAGWKIALGHGGMLPPDFGVEPDYLQQHGGMKLAKVTAGGPSDKAGLQSGDVLMEYGGRENRESRRPRQNALCLLRGRESNGHRDAGTRENHEGSYSGCAEVRHVWLSVVSRASSAADGEVLPEPKLPFGLGAPVECSVKVVTAAETVLID